MTIIKKVGNWIWKTQLRRRWIIYIWRIKLASEVRWGSSFWQPYLLPFALCVGTIYFVSKRCAKGVWCWGSSLQSWRSTLPRRHHVVMYLLLAVKQITSDRESRRVALKPESEPCHWCAVFSPLRLSSILVWLALSTVSGCRFCRESCLCSWNSTDDMEDRTRFSMALHRKRYFKKLFELKFAKQSSAEIPILN